MSARRHSHAAACNSPVGARAALASEKWPSRAPASISERSLRRHRSTSPTSCRVARISARSRAAGSSAACRAAAPATLPSPPPPAAPSPGASYRSASTCDSRMSDCRAVGRDRGVFLSVTRRGVSNQLSATRRAPQPPAPPPPRLAARPEGRLHRLVGQEGELLRHLLRSLRLAARLDGQEPQALDPLRGQVWGGREGRRSGGGFTAQPGRGSVVPEAKRRGRSWEGGCSEWGGGPSRAGRRRGRGPRRGARRIRRSGARRQTRGGSRPTPPRCRRGGGRARRPSGRRGRGRRSAGGPPARSLRR